VGRESGSEEDKNIGEENKERQWEVMNLLIRSQSDEMGSGCGGCGEKALGQSYEERVEEERKQGMR